MAEGLDRETLEELCGFVTHARLDVNKQAVEILRGYEEHEDFVRFARADPPKVCRPLLRHAEGDDLALAEDALAVLVNLSAQEELAGCMVDASAVRRALGLLRQEPLAPMALSLLANLTRLRRAQAQAAPSVALIQPFLRQDGLGGSSSSRLLENLLALGQGRQEFDLDAAAKLLTTRKRKLVLPLLRQMATDGAEHERLCENEELLARVGTFLYPEAAKHSEEFAARREQLHPVILAGAGLCDEPQVRSVACEFLLRLGGTSRGRAAMQEVGLYEVVRAWHLEEASPEVKEQLESLAPLLQYSEEQLEELCLRPEEPGRLTAEKRKEEDEEIALALVEGPQSKVMDSVD